MGFEVRLLSHDMRSMESTILNEHGWDPELIEVALAHVDKDKVRSAYNRSRTRPPKAISCFLPGSSAEPMTYPHSNSYETATIAMTILQRCST